MSDLSAPPPPCGEALQETAPSGIGKAEDAPGAPAVGKEKLYFGPSLFICWQQSCQVQRVEKVRLRRPFPSICTVSLSAL